MKIPFGYSLENGKVVPNKTERALIKAIKLLKKSGVSYNEIVSILEAKGYGGSVNCRYSFVYMFYPNNIRFLFNE